MPDESALTYAALTVFGCALGGLVLALLLRGRIAPRMLAWRERRFDAAVRRALASSTPQRLARYLRASARTAVDPVLYARHWTIVGMFSRRFRGAADRVERGLPFSDAVAEAFANALYGRYTPAEQLLASRTDSLAHEGMALLQLEYLVRLLRDGDARGALVCAHQGLAAAKSPSLHAWTAAWRSHQEAAEIAAGDRSFADIDACIARPRSAVSLLLACSSAIAHARRVGDDARASAYSEALRGIAPHAVVPQIRRIGVDRRNA